MLRTYDPNVESLAKQLKGLHIADHETKQAIETIAEALLILSASKKKPQLRLVG